MTATRRAEIDRLLERLERTRLMIYGSADAWACYHAARDLAGEVARLERLLPRQARLPEAG
jgi:nitrogenase molybdenum-iron protein alpha/beta subunit